MSIFVSMTTTKLEIIPNDALINVQFSGSFHRKLSQLALALGESRPSEEFQKALKTLDSKVEPEDLYQLTVQTIVSILFEIETQAREQKKTTFIEFDPDKDEVIGSSTSQNPPVQ